MAIENVYTPQFEAYCLNDAPNFKKCLTLQPQDQISLFPESEANEMRVKLNNYNQYETQFFLGFIKQARENLLKNNQFKELKNQKIREQYLKFFQEMERALQDRYEKLQKTPNGSQAITNSSYTPKATQGQSFYDNIMHVLGYDGLTVGASMMFYMLFASLRFLMATPYIEQIAEYCSTSAEKRFDPNHLTDLQIKANLNEHSTRQQILQAGFLPAPDLAEAFELEFKSFMQKLGGDAKQPPESDQKNALEARLVRGKVS